jgi:drug/metabolite transporter (DMT)-like permease
VAGVRVFVLLSLLVQAVASFEIVDSMPCFLKSPSSCAMTIDEHSHGRPPDESTGSRYARVVSSPLHGPLLALSAAALFGLSAPAAKLLLGRVDPWLLAGLLYLGSGIGLGAWRAMRGGSGEASLTRGDVPWVAGAIVAGGLAGPVLLMFGLARASAAQSSLLLNLEGVLTAVLAWVVFREHYNARTVAGMVAITLGAVVLTWSGDGRFALDASALLVAGACLAWAVDNNLTRVVSSADPVQIAMLKGLAAGGVNVLVAASLGASWPAPGTLGGAGAVGVLGYGTSLVLFVLALRHVGTSRTGAYFSTAPFIGAVAAILVLREPATPRLFVAAGLMGVGVWLHLTESHDHEHAHEGLAHEHAHHHDEHHQHAHEAGVPAGEPHSHRHVHAPLRHKHPHYPDLHHRHDH